MTLKQKQAITDALAEIRDWSPNLLASSDMADTYSPERDSAGAKFLVDVRDAVIELVEYRIDEIDDAAWFDSVNDDGSVSQIADQAPDIYTATRWREFVDLGAFTEDPTELGFDGSDMEQGAGICLYIIAERLAHAILNHVREVVSQYEIDQEDD